MSLSNQQISRAVDPVIQSLEARRLLSGAPEEYVDESDVEEVVELVVEDGEVNSDDLMFWTMVLDAPEEGAVDDASEEEPVYKGEEGEEIPPYVRTLDGSDEDLIYFTTVMDDEEATPDDILTTTVVDEEGGEPVDGEVRITDADTEFDPDMIFYALGGVAGGSAEMVGRTLKITGTAGRDSILVKKSDKAGRLEVVVNGQVSTFLAGSVKKIKIDALGGNDRIEARGISKKLDVDGGSGNDVIFGGAGRDSIAGGTGNDRIRGRAGRDLITGGAGDDKVNGNQGADSISGGTGDDDLFGDSGNDELLGGPGRDKLRGGLHNDLISGGTGRDKNRGGAGLDECNDTNGLLDSDPADQNVAAIRIAYPEWWGTQDVMPGMEDFSEPDWADWDGDANDLAVI